MSTSGTWQSTAPNRSGRCISTALTSSPPFEPPRMARREGCVNPCFTSSSAAAMKSSKTCCLFCNIPARCHSSPYSLPPRNTACAYTPPRSSQGYALPWNAGVIATLNPPYPPSNAGAVPSFACPLRCTTKTGTRVPSFEVAKICSVSYSDGSTGTFTRE